MLSAGDKIENINPLTTDDCIMCHKTFSLLMALLVMSQGNRFGRSRRMGQGEVGAWFTQMVKTAWSYLSKIYSEVVGHCSF